MLWNNRKVGKPLYFESPSQLWDYFMDYLEDCEERKQFANYAGFRCFIHTSQQTLYNYVQKEEYFVVFSMIHDELDNFTLNDTKVHPTVKKLYMQHRLGYEERITTRNEAITSSQDVIQLDANEFSIKLDDLEQKIKLLKSKNDDKITTQSDI